MERIHRISACAFYIHHKPGVLAVFGCHECALKLTRTARTPRRLFGRTGTVKRPLPGAPSNTDGASRVGRQRWPLPP